MGQIVSIVYRPDSVPDKPEDHYSRVPLQATKLVEGHGIEGDRKGGHPKRQINIMAQESLDQLAPAGFKVQPGEMGEQIIVSGLSADLNTLAEGTRLQLGEAIVEITTPRTGCDRFEAIQHKQPSEAAGLLGMMARVVTGGGIRVGDTIKILEYV